MERKPKSLAFLTAAGVLLGAALASAASADTEVFLQGSFLKIYGGVLQQQRTTVLLRLSYALRRLSVSASLDNVRNDGADGEGGFVASDIERIDAGRGNDTLVGNAGRNQFFGGDGDDDITGAENVDDLERRRGDDILRDDLDRQRDDFACGAGSDQAFLDLVDTRASRPRPSTSTRPDPGGRHRAARSTWSGTRTAIRRRRSAASV